MKNIGIAINPLKDRGNVILNKVVSKFREKFKLQDIYIFNSYDIDKQNLNNIDLLVVLGGDGTLLGIARNISEDFNKPILGINIGNLGFLSSIEISDIDMAIEKIQNEQYKITDRMLLRGHIFKSEGNSKKSFKALNDIVIAKGTLSRMVKFKVYVDNKLYTTFRGDGLIVATPTGSTAYSFSAGGPFIYPDLEIIMITPICPHTKSMQTIVLNGNSKVEIIADNRDEKVFLTVDGQQAVEVNHNDRVIISEHKKRLKLLLFDDYDYFKVLRNKILNNSKECDGD